MAKKLLPGESVLVPAALIGLQSSAPAALVKTKVSRVEGKRVVLDLPNGQQSAAIGSSLVHREAAVLIVRVGDFHTEPSLLDPLAKSLLQYLRLLLPDDTVRLLELRSLAELDQAWPTTAPAYSHVVLVGHGYKEGLIFGVDGKVPSAELARRMVVQPNNRKWSFLSLCCQTGYAAFAKQFSCETVCREIVAPFHSVHGAIASQFAQSFFAYHFVEGETVAVAFRHARAGTPGAISFRLWRSGRLTSDGQLTPSA